MSGKIVHVLIMSYLSPAPRGTDLNRKVSKIIKILLNHAIPVKNLRYISILIICIISAHISISNSGKSSVRIIRITCLYTIG